MKRVFALLLAVLLLVGLAACSGNGAGTTATANDKFSKNDLYLTIHGTKYTCDGLVDELLATFGEDYTYAEAISCAYDGLDKNFAYDELDIYTRPDGEKDIVTELCAYDGVESSKNIVIGSSADSVRSAYGEPTAENARLMKYLLAPASAESEGASLYFKLNSDGAVTAIGITAEVLIGEE